MFDDLLAANARYQTEFHDSGVAGGAARGLAVLTCIDSRIDPLRMLGLVPGDAKIIRNAGARVTDDALRSLVLAVHLLNVDRICVVQHTDCAMTSRTDDEIHAEIPHTDDMDFLTMTDQTATLASDIERIRAHPAMPDDLVVGGFVFDVRSGELTPSPVA